MRWKNPGIARFVIPTFAVFLLALMAPALVAQSQTISGTVIDQSGAVVPGAQVKITDAAKGTLAREVVTNETGRFQAINMQPGSYLIAVEMSGFKTAEVKINLDVNSKLDVGQIKLEVGQVSEVVSVTETTPVVQTNTMEKAFLVSSNQIQELPMNGRNWVALMSTVPGMTSGARNDFEMNFNDVSGFHALGGRGSQNNFYLDGSPNLDVGDNQSQYTQPSIDSIAEFKVQQSSFNAEYGRNSGMVVAVQTKAGSGRYHGTAYWYVRNDAFDAIRPLTAKNAILRYNQFGGNLSGWIPLPKVSTASEKKLFFFYNRENTIRNNPTGGYRDIPAPDILVNGNFSAWLTDKNMDYAPFKTGTVFKPGTVKKDGPGGAITTGVPFENNTVPKSMWQPLSANLIKMYTGIPGYSSLPAAPNPGYVRYTYNNANKLNKYQDLLRVDYALSSRMNTYFRWVNDDQSETIDTGIWTGEPFPLQPQFRPKPGSSWSWNIVNSFTPTLAAETILSYNHQSQSLSIVEPNPLDRDKLGVNWTQLYPATNITNNVPDFSAGAIGSSWGSPGWHNDGKDYAFTENVTWVKKNHVFKMGFYYNRDNKKQTGNWGFSGNINFNGDASMVNDTGNGLANLMLGNFRSYTQSNAHVYPYFRFQSWEGYIQDSWKLSRRLTLEYGVRYQHTTPTYTYLRDGTPPTEGTWKLYSVDLSKYDASKRPLIDLSTGRLIGDAMTALSPLGLVCDPCDGVPRGFSPAENFFAPRLGFAYDMLGDGRMALRAGFGIFYERLRQNNFNFGAGAKWPNTSSATALYGSVANVDTSVTQGKAPITPPGGYSIWPADNTMPSIYSWYMGVQRELPAAFSLDLSYSGNHAVHLMDQRTLNGIPAGTYLQYPNLLKSVNNKTDALRPYYGWGTLTSIETLAYSSYNAMMFRLSRRFTNNLAFNLNYTWSKVLDLVDNDSDGIRNGYNMRMNYAVAGYDQTNVTTFDFIYQLPGPKGSLDNAFTRQVLGGWEVSGIFRAQSGMPITITSNGSVMGSDVGSPNPNLVGDPYAGQTRWQWINPAAFQRPQDGQYGNMGRNALRLPGVRNVDATLQKSFRFTEGSKLAMRLEVFNLFNHPQVWGINTGFTADTQGGGISSTNKNLGQPNGYREARILQIGLRLSF